MGYEEKLIEWYQVTIETVALKLSSDTERTITFDQVGKAVAEVYGFTDNTEVFDKVLEEGLGLVEILQDHFFSEALGTIELFDDERIIPDQEDQEIFEVLVKNNGQQWEIHKNDPDPFPSDPHAHNYSSGLKLDLSNGNLFKKKQQRGSIKKKLLLEIRQKCTDKGITLPILTV
jgi:hypothetical protein